MDEDRELDMGVKADRLEAMHHVAEGGELVDADEAHLHEDDYEDDGESWDRDGWEAADDDGDWADDADWDDGDFEDDDDEVWQAMPIAEESTVGDLAADHAQAARDFRDHALALAKQDGETLTSRDLQVLLEASVQGGFTPTSTEIAWSQMQREREDATRERLHTGSARDMRAARRELFTKIANKEQ